jgi:RNA 2',3'-cyclic 3'-phosphodiesterase
MRLFVAIDLPKEVKDSLFSLQNKVKDAKVSWVSKKNLHLTLKFLGDVPEDKLDLIQGALNSIKFDSFNLKLTNLGFFPSKIDPKVLFVGIDPEDIVIQLQQKIDGELLSFSSSKQFFEAHITLGRIKAIRRENFFETVKSINIDNLSFKINSFSLFSSRLSGRSITYEVIKNFSLS